MKTMKIASTHELIKKLQQYEKENGVGAITCISTRINSDREIEYTFEIEDGYYNNDNTKITKIDISSIRESDIFESKDGEQ